MGREAYLIPFWVLGYALAGAGWLIWHTVQTVLILIALPFIIAWGVLTGKM